MGKDWSIPSVKIWKEMYRVLKPGGHLLVFGGTRTFDLVALGIRAAGFEYRDTIADHFGVMTLAWIQAEGMPKSTNIAREIDKKMGFPTPKGQKHVPKSDECKEWLGWGTALKPTWEPILVFRKPLDGTLAQNALEHGTGGVNIDGCRVSTSEDLNGGAYAEDGGNYRRKRWGGGDLGRQPGQFEQPSGRWPPNMTLTHLPGCKIVGTETLRGDLRGDPGGHRPGGFGDVGADKGDKKPNARVYGNEEVPIYECVEGCPVKELGEQSGECRSSGDYPTSYSNAAGYNDLGHSQGPLYEDRGTASRFFPIFEGQKTPSAPFFYCAKAKAKETTLDGRLENDHPTKKPLKLMRWLVKLVAAKGSLVLDPYCGSGSTLHAALLEEVHFTGIDRDPGYVEMCQKRIEIVRGDMEASDDDFTALCELLDEDS